MRKPCKDDLQIVGVPSSICRSWALRQLSLLWHRQNQAILRPGGGKGISDGLVEKMLGLVKVWHPQRLVSLYWREPGSFPILGVSILILTHNYIDHRKSWRFSFIYVVNHSLFFKHTVLDDAHGREANCQIYEDHWIPALTKHPHLHIRSLTLVGLSASQV